MSSKLISLNYLNELVQLYPETYTCFERENGLFFVTDNLLIYYRESKLLLNISHVVYEKVNDKWVLRFIIVIRRDSTKLKFFSSGQFNLFGFKSIEKYLDEIASMSECYLNSCLTLNISEPWSLIIQREFDKTSELKQKIRSNKEEIFKIGIHLDIINLYFPGLYTISTKNSMNF